MDKDLCNWVRKSWKEVKWEDWSLEMQGCLQKPLGNYVLETMWKISVLTAVKAFVQLVPELPSSVHLLISFLSLLVSLTPKMSERADEPVKGNKAAAAKKGLFLLSQWWKASQLPLCFEEYGDVLENLVVQKIPWPVNTHISHNIRYPSSCVL